MKKNLRFQNKSISYWIEGKGKPVMLVHGFAEDHEVWFHQIDYLKQNFQLILPDLPGSGCTTVIRSQLGKCYFNGHFDLLHQVGNKQKTSA